MLRIKVPAQEFFDENSQEFIEINEVTLTMEHSLISISKWESKWKKSYFANEPKKTTEEVLDHLRCMTITPQNVNPLVYRGLSKENFKAIMDYIDDPMTATTINEIKRPGAKKEIVTSEIVYYWMIAQNIPIEFEKWHINRLMTLIKVCAIKNDPNPKKMSKSAVMKQNRILNQARRARMHSKG